MYQQTGPDQQPTGRGLRWVKLLQLGGPMKVLKIEFVYEDFDTRFAL